MNNKKIFIYIICVLVCSIMSIIAYKKYLEYTKQIIIFKDNFNLNKKSIELNLMKSIDNTDFTKISSKAVNVVVSIKNYSNKYNQKTKNFDPLEFFFGFPNEFKENNKKSPGNNDYSKISGSGVIISSKGYIITNRHVVENSQKIEITLNNQKTYEGTLIGVDSNTDIALLKIKEKNLPFVYFSNSDNIQIGEWVLAIGNPFGLNSTVTAGIVSAKSRNLGILNGNGNIPIESFIQTDAAINPGNSGGALINYKGELIGLNTAIHSRTGSYEGYGFAIPCNLIEKVIKDIKQYGVVQRAFLGIQVMDLSDENHLKNYNEKNKTNILSQQGIMILKISKKSGALNAGLKNEDIIKIVDGYVIKNFAYLSDFIGRKKPGDKIKVKIIRDKKYKELIVTLRDINGNIYRKIKNNY